MKLDSFKHSIALDALTLTPVLTPLLHQYRMGLDSALLANRIELQIGLKYHGDASVSWEAVPADGEFGFLKAAAKTSLHLQKTMRTWLQMHWFANPDNFSDCDRTAALLAYLACKPFYAKLKNVYTYDLLDDWSAGAVDRQIRQEMPELLGSVSSLLRVLGRHELADYYNPVHAVWFVGEIQRRGKDFYELLRRESKIIHAWVPRLGKTLSERQMQEARKETRSALNEIFYRDEDLSCYAPVFEIEAVTAVDLYIGRNAGSTLTLAGNPEPVPQTAALLDATARANVIPFPAYPRPIKLRNELLELSSSRRAGKKAA